MGAADNGYRCPLCNKTFVGSDGFSKLQADHMIPFSNNRQGTTWENMILLCRKCNQEKYDSLIFKEGQCEVSQKNWTRH
ncbi:MAG: HNH endonuclease [Bacteroidales bacterium]